MTSLPRLAVSCPLLRLTTRCHRPAGGLNAPLWPRLLDAPCERCALRFRAGGRGGARGLRTAARVRARADDERGDVEVVHVLNGAFLDRRVLVGFSRRRQSPEPSA